MHQLEKVVNKMDIEQARFNMVEQQIRPWEVLDSVVLDLLFTVKREEFVPDAYRAIAFTDMEIPLGHQQFMMPPRVEARLLQELAPMPGEHILEIGTGSGYLTALLAKRAAQVTSVEFHDDLQRLAAARLDAAGVRNVHLKSGDAAHSPVPIVGDQKFDAIVITGSVPVIPPAYLDALKPGGRLLAIVGDAPAMTATLCRRGPDGAFAATDLFETVVAPLINADQPSRFEF
jgi:protein-L-isoaspartate(D-aspartate) O-methyltransferase